MAIIIIISIIITNAKKPSQLNFIDSFLQLQQSSISFKFLRYWFTLDDKQTKQTKLITDEIFNLIISKDYLSLRRTRTKMKYSIELFLKPLIFWRELE